MLKRLGEKLFGRHLRSLDPLVATRVLHGLRIAYFFGAGSLLLFTLENIPKNAFSTDTSIDEPRDSSIFIDGDSEEIPQTVLGRMIAKTRLLTTKNPFSRNHETSEIVAEKP